ncbi:MAG: ParA family protein [Acidobacteria bacterium]|nr:ParA family protein [Acidobacteriota bacterium]
MADTAPHSGADAVTVARLSDHILIPLQPSFPDLAAITRTIDIAQVARTPATIVLNLALVNHTSTDDARTVIESTAAAAAPVVLHRRVAHVNSFNAGRCAAEYQPAGKAARELRALFRWLQDAGIIPAARNGQAP